MTSSLTVRQSRPAVLLRVVLMITALVLIGSRPAHAAGRNVAHPASAITNNFQGYDLTQTTPRPCDLVEKPYCNQMGLTNATSHFNATMISASGVYHYPVSDLTCGCGELYSYSSDVAAGQVVGILCYTANGVWDKVDYRKTVSGRYYYSGLFIAYVPDSRVNLSYSDRVTYTRPC